LYSNYFGISADPVLRLYESICQSHPFWLLIKFNQRDKSQAVALLGKINSTLPYQPAPAFRHAKVVKSTIFIGLQMAQLPGISYTSRAMNYDHTYSSLLCSRSISSKFSMPVPLDELLEISPRSEIAQLAIVNKNSTKPEELLVIEKQKQDSVVILAGIAARYKKSSQTQDRIRVLKRMTEISEDDTIYSQLAFEYFNQKLEEEWAALAIKMLELPRQTLATVRWEVQLAYWYARKDDKEKAIEHAKHSYISGSAQSYQCLIAIHAKYGDYSAANTIFQKMSEHYKMQAPDWLRWCICNNKGDAKLAQEMSEKHFQNVGATQTPAYLASLFHFYVIVEKPKKAFEALMLMRNLNNVDPPTILIGACICDMVGRKPERDRLVQHLIDLEKNKRKAAESVVWIAYAKKLQIFLRRPDKSKLNFKLVNEMVKNTNDLTIQNIYLASAYFLEANRFTNDSTNLLYLAAILTGDFPSTANVIARQVLRKQGATIGPGNTGIQAK